MRAEFAKHIEKRFSEDLTLVFLTGDLGFMALEGLKEAMGNRFVNIGVSEQNMISVAASLAYEGLTPVCYSIASFIAFRPAEQIRIDLCLHNLNVKMVGNGGGFGYGIMGAIHHAIEDIAVLSSFQNMKCFIPFCNEDVPGAVDFMFSYNGPSYLRLGFGNKPSGLFLPDFSPIRKIINGERVTIIGMGSLIINAINALDNLKSNLAEVFVVSVMPLNAISDELKLSILKTGKVIVIEEHIRRGGLGENIAALILESNLKCIFSHLYIKGYTNKLYGDQSYHLEINGLSTNAIQSEIIKIVNE